MLLLHHPWRFQTGQLQQAKRAEGMKSREDRHGTQKSQVAHGSGKMLGRHAQGGALV